MVDDARPDADPSTSPGVIPNPDAEGRDDASSNGEPSGVEEGAAMSDPDEGDGTAGDGFQFDGVFSAPGASTGTSTSVAVDAALSVKSAVLKSGGGILIATTRTRKSPAFPQHGLRPCEAVARGDDREGDLLAERYEPLTRQLPLVGDLAMRPDRNGGIHLVERLRDEAPWHDQAITLIERQLEMSLWAGRPWLRWRPLCLAGPAGTGKSHLASLIGDVVGMPSRLLSLGGADDVRILEGTARGYTSVQPAWPALVMSQDAVANPLLVLDEADKVGPWRGQAIHDVLLMMLEPSTAARFYDKALLANVDLSACLWILTVNDPRRLPVALRSRLDVVWSDGPLANHFELVVESLMRAIANANGLPRAALPQPPRSAVATMYRTFARHRSVRALHAMLRLAVAAGVGADPQVLQ